MACAAIQTASATRGALVITKARCLDCHKLGDQGQGVGPDLTGVGARFNAHDVLESIIKPIPYAVVPAFAELRATSGPDVTSAVK